MRSELPGPWSMFVRDVDRRMSTSVEVHCLGGFVLAVMWGLPRPTGDLDYVEAEPPEGNDTLLTVAGEGSALARRHRLSFHRVTIAELPEGYRSRLIDITPLELRRLRFQALEPHDLVLAKLARNSRRDREDVRHLVGRGALDRRILEGRFESELRPYLQNEEREATTLRLWLAEFFGVENPGWS